MNWIRSFDDVGMTDVASVGGKNASLGEVRRALTRLGIRTPDGFATTADAYRSFMRGADLERVVRDSLAGLDISNIDLLQAAGARVRSAILAAPLPAELMQAVKDGYRRLEQQYGAHCDVAVRSSATAEDLPEASFAGQQETFLNIHGETMLLDAVRRCYASLFTDRAIVYRVHHGFDHAQVALSVGVQKMVREPKEENPMLGFRGASRYYDPRYREGFALECRAMRRVREVMGLENVKLMVPFCRTVEEGRRVIAEMATHELVQGERDLEIYVMCEIPSNVTLAAEFAQVFDGFSIGSNDLTQLILGVDRDSELVAHLFDERNDAVTQTIAQVIRAAHAAGRKIGICGQAPSDYPEFARFLVAQGIDSISLNPDSVLKTMLAIVEAEKPIDESAAETEQHLTPPGTATALVGAPAMAETNS